jgi:acyl-CoA thioester hydrolase
MSRFHEQVHGVYFDDLDPFGILHNARYLLLFERTLGAFWQMLGFGGFQVHPDQLHLVRANQMDYISAVEGQQSVRCRVWIAKLGRTSMTFGFRMMPMDEDRDCAIGSRTVVHVDAEQRRPTPWTDEFRRQVKPWLPESKEET